MRGELSSSEEQLSLPIQLPEGLRGERSCSTVVGFFAASRQTLYEQFRFEFMNEVVTLIPRSHHGYLDIAILDFFRSDRALFNLARRVSYSRGLSYIGELVQLSREQLAPFALYDQRYLDRLEGELSNVNIGLNARAAGWRSPKQVA